MIAVGGCSTVRRIAGPHHTFPSLVPDSPWLDALSLVHAYVTSAKERSVAERSVAGTSVRQS